MHNYKLHAYMTKVLPLQLSSQRAHFLMCICILRFSCADDAIVMGNMYLGAEDEKFNVTAYYVQQAEMNIYGTFTPKHCYPATEGYIGESDASE